MNCKAISAGLVVAAFLVSSAFGQIGRRWPPEKKVVPDPVTGIPLSFLTTNPGGTRRSTRPISNGPPTVNGSSSAVAVEAARRPSP